MLTNWFDNTSKKYPGFAKILGNISWLLFDKILRMGTGIIVGAWIARYLGPEQFGLWSYASGFSFIFSAFATLGLDSIIIRELVKAPDRTNTLLGSAFALKLSGSIVAFLLSTISILLLNNREKLTIILVGISAAGFIFQSISVIDLYFQSKTQSRNTVIASNAAFFLITIFKIYLINNSGSLLEFAWAGLAEIIITSIFTLLTYRANHLNIRAWTIDRTVMWALLKESSPLLLAALAVTLYMRLDIIMLGAILGEKSVGIYSAATKISEIIYFIPSVIVASVAPSIIKHHSNDQQLYSSTLGKLYFIIGWLAIVLSISLSILSNNIIHLVYGSQYQDAGNILKFHIWASVAVFLGVASSQYLITEKLQKISFYRTLIGLICNLALNLILIPCIGVLGAVIATVISYYIATFSLVFFKKTRQHSFFLAMAIFRKTNLPHV